MSPVTAKKKTLWNATRGFPRAVLSAFLLIGAVTSNAQVAQTPLSVADGVPGNLVLTPSVEWPTLDSMANILPNYDPAIEFPGYFDPNKCYNYIYSATEADRRFEPSGAASAHTCSASANEWSGNFMNWAATQTIDPFRKALTGGYRVKDTAATTWLEKARSDDNTGSNIYPDRNLTSLAHVTGAIPSTVWTSVGTRVRTYGNKMRFRGPGGASLAGTVVDYDPGSHTLDDDSADTVFEVSVRVAVCYSAALAEANCVRYGSNYKPEGLIQEYSRRIRFSAFGFLNDHSALKDGGVMRAKQKFVGPRKLDPVSHLWVPNPNREWNASTGVFIRNPDATDATATAGVVGTTSGGSSYSTGTDAAPLGTTTLEAKTVTDSGVINYINRFGQMTTKNHKTYDPVSELYYTALRYLRRQSNIAAYSSVSGSADERYELVDGFPVIANWDGAANDPYQYRCQKTAILGIGDANSHKDKNLPGHDAHSGYNDNDTNTEPTDDGAPYATTPIDVWAATQKVAEIEGITISGTGTFTGRENSAYIAGLAYMAHTSDMRPDLEGHQTISTHWVDVRENQYLEPRARNQYWLAAKYGGFEVPDPVEAFDPFATTVTIPVAAWHTNADTLESGDLRPDNFYVASDADKMILSLTTAFQKIADENVGSSASLAANSTRIDTETRTFQAQFVSGKWTGELNSYIVEPDGSLRTPPAWSASTSLAPADWATRRIFINNPGTGQVAFEWANLSVAQRSALGSTELVDYLRGDGSREQETTGGIYRNRSAILGDIVNSTPVFVGAPNANLHTGALFNGASSYGAFAATTAGRTGVVYVGANDGMLHAFNATDGSEMYAFIPNSVALNGLEATADPDYAHRYFVDGDMAIADVYNGSAWRTILVGTLGRGGPGVFALDITDPGSIQFLWEKSGSDIAALGKNIGRPVIAQVANGDWRVLLGNGPESAADTGNLVTINVFTGAVTTINVSAATGNALSAVLARDTDGDRFADTVYAGDALGNLWKITGINGTGAVTLLFAATDGVNPQPITAAPLVARDPATAIVWVFFGTGSYLSDADFLDTQQQTWYGIKDEGVTVLRSQLMPRVIESTIQYAINVVADPNDDVLGQRTISEGTAGDLAGRRGWYMNFDVSRERMVVPNRLQGGALIGTTRIPDPTDACDPSGGGFVMAINPFTGARLDRTFFDLNNDGLFNNADLTGGEINSGVGFSSSPNNPIFVENVMQISLDDGTTRTIRTQGSSVDTQRMNWREITN